MPILSFDPEFKIETKNSATVGRSLVFTENQTVSNRPYSQINSHNCMYLQNCCCFLTENHKFILWFYISFLVEECVKKKLSCNCCILHKHFKRAFFSQRIFLSTQDILHELHLHCPLFLCSECFLKYRSYLTIWKPSPSGSNACDSHTTCLVRSQSS